jgi:PBP1b-binding outer membrane lipoprotein LpoB
MKHHILIAACISLILGGCAATKVAKESSVETSTTQPAEHKNQSLEKMNEGGIVGSGKEDECENNTDGECNSSAPKLN